MNTGHETMTARQVINLLRPFAASNAVLTGWSRDLTGWLIVNAGQLSAWRVGEDAYVVERDQSWYQRSENFVPTTPLTELTWRARVTAIRQAKP